MSSYGAAKRRDMARSVLPSSRRVSARWDKAHVNRARRRTVRRALNDVDLDYIDIDTRMFDTTPDLSDRAYRAVHVADRVWKRDMNEAIYDRRNGDKIQPLMRWAPTQVSHLRVEDRLSKMRTVMSDDLIGRHAISHLYGDVWEPRLPHSRRWLWDMTPEEQEAKQRRRDMERFMRACRAAQIISYIAWVYDNDLIGVFNRFVTEPDIARGGIDDPGYPPITQPNGKSRWMEETEPHLGIVRWVSTNLSGSGYRTEPNYTLGKKLIDWFERAGMPVL